jgi:hypothetical protein
VGHDETEKWRAYGHVKVTDSRQSHAPQWPFSVACSMKFGLVKILCLEA